MNRSLIRKIFLEGINPYIWLLLVWIVLIIPQTYNLMHSRSKAAIQVRIDEVANDPGNPDAHMRLGQELFNSGKTEQAEAQYRMAIMIRPDLREVHNDLAAILMEKGRLAQAEDELKKELAIWDNPLSHINLGVIYLNSGRLAESVGHFERAAILDPQQPQAHYYLGMVLLSSGDVINAEKHLKAELEINPLYDRALLALGILYESTNDIDKAVRYLSEAVETNPGLTDAYQRLSRLRKLRR